MKEYLKMADVFVGEYTPKRRIDAWPPSRYGETLVELSGSPAQYAAHAINSHDELVAEVERLTKSAELAIMTLEEVDRVLTERIKNGAYDLDDISGEVTYALDKLSARE
ncbi:hypothetical protein [Aeromonas phage 51]|uniref:Uncharacterized protein n=3 Tax=Popoffvirus pv56 TaxID=2560283 RepID=A0A219YBE3_9CAUD|nr:hypothetical protein F394_gp52 [Aeromonas phage vB_AsaM-56]AFC22648.1 hypothetical protein AsaM-56_0052 [Aeromonas phage vB_AsaM-56]APU01275.1 hypothetical protein [Aeromonas phage 51]APU01359.1 hypothetical protein [Aeromonas phage 56]